ncbi:hypothetical protein LJ655_27780 [Paraburkholderia sp. MMS20-SJTN17]|uniref:DUF4148 domain-containing protein n=1 Tax=Paraburkholderia translucens TaxID=2886945 RepID=A0ABS8KMJ8_9BURK|nr:hypothetical protein [Paraburkholderia sp. MMS20-SJTN17]MCC8405612.1 hypothetical protein [Paraburkholderia sp. MMS20-SJTN17]
MRTISAALFSAAAALPLLAHAATVADPTDAGASVPVASVPSAFDGYRSYQDRQAPSWQQLNRAVTPSRGTAGMGHAQQPGETSNGTRAHEHGGETR